jgi:hypothetical protein
VRIIVDVPELQPERASCYSVASYVRAVLILRALREELANAVLEVARCKKTLASRLQAHPAGRGAGVVQRAWPWSGCPVTITSQSTHFAATVDRVALGSSMNGDITL